MATVAALAPRILTTDPPLHRFSVEQYHRMVEAGVFGPEERTELIEGLVIKKMVRLPPHDAALNRLMRRLARLLPEEWALRVQSAVTARDSEPEPDLAVALGPEENYDARHPGPKDLALVVEVSDSTLV